MGLKQVKGLEPNSESEGEREGFKFQCEVEIEPKYALLRTM
jgi:hypothetical protein